MTGMQRNMRLGRVLATVAVVLCGLASGARAGELRLGRYFGDDMVLQRDKANTIRGVSANGATIEVAFAGQRKSTKADDSGVWSVTLDPMAASAKPQGLTVTTGTAKIELQNIVIGDVIFMALQTSIDISLGQTDEGKREAGKLSTNPRFRAISIKTQPAAAPQQDLTAEMTDGWCEVSRESALKMSAAAYYLGRELASEQDLPVGIVDLNLGSAFPISWLSRESLMETDTFYDKNDVSGQLARFDKIMDLKARGEPVTDKDGGVGDPLNFALFPSGGYNAVLHPFRGLALKSMIVQLGNNYPYMLHADARNKGTHLDRDHLNRLYIETYDIRKTGVRMDPVTTPRIPREWRAVFGDAELPMAFILPPGSALDTLARHGREMRELQRLMAEENAGVGLIMPGSENIPMSAQPKDPALLAERCLRWVRGTVYQKAGTAPTGPLFEKLDAHMNKATVHFKAGTAEGLQAAEGALDCFEAKGVDGDYFPVKASIDGDRIQIESDKVNRIVHVRYNWNGMPDQGLVNADGLPAMPFRTEKAVYEWFFRNAENDLPEEYSTPANEWKSGDVTLVNVQLKTFGYDNFTGWLGPIGVRTGPFGPNMGVREVKRGSPSDGRLLVGDVIFSANGKMVGERAWEVMGAAITDSETEALQGKLQLGVRRAGKNINVDIPLTVMGSYSSTAPFDCLKTEKIITDLEAWVVAQGAGAGFLNNDALFLLATGNPALQGYVRRAVYQAMKAIDLEKPIDKFKERWAWHNSADAILFGEYYLATGDRNVLPYLKSVCDRLAATQRPEGGWRHNVPGPENYGIIPNAGLPGMLGMHFAMKAGVDIDKDAYAKGIRFYRDGQADTGHMIYGLGVTREVPVPLSPAAMAAGKLTSWNGGLSAAGILMKLTDNHKAAHLATFISAYAWNNTFEGHGGNFWNNVWTPLGAHAHGQEAFINFWKNHRWYRECNRMFDGGLIQNEACQSGAGTGIALVAPRGRLQIVGAPASPFAADAPAVLKPALDAYGRKDYAACETIVGERLASGTVAKKDRPTVEYLARAARELQQSIEVDLARMKKLAAEGNPDEAKSFLAGLRGIMPDGDARLAAIEQVIASAKQEPKPKDEARKTVDADKNAEWECLITEIVTGRSKQGTGKVEAAQASKWRMKVIESMAQAPDGWVTPTFVDSEWDETNLPISWPLYHTALFRTTFTVKDKDAFDGLRFRAWLYMQQGIEIYINGKLVAKVNNIEEKTGTVEAEFNPFALEQLKNGENTLAITTRQNWRWGMLFMNVYNDGFGFMLDARKTSKNKE